MVELSGKQDAEMTLHGSSQWFAPNGMLSTTRHPSWNCVGNVLFTAVFASRGGHSHICCSHSHGCRSKIWTLHFSTWPLYRTKIDCWPFDQCTYYCSPLCSNHWIYHL